jgi:hypothetical protein
VIPVVDYTTVKLSFFLRLCLKDHAANGEVRMLVGSALSDFGLAILAGIISALVAVVLLLRFPTGYRWSYTIEVLQSPGESESRCFVRLCRKKGWPRKLAPVDVVPAVRLRYKDRTLPDGNWRVELPAPHYLRDLEHQDAVLHFDFSGLEDEEVAKLPAELQYLIKNRTLPVETFARMTPAVEMVVQATGYNRVTGLRWGCNRAYDLSNPGSFRYTDQRQLGPPTS